MELLLTLLLVCLLQGSSRSQEVVTANGRLRGSRVNVLGKSVDVYLGVPYAKPPVGDLRFMHPQAGDSWGTDVKDALQWKPSCLQPQFAPSADPLRQQAADYSEDCLYLNVWVPSNASSGSNLATLVWIHGGSFFVGSPNVALNDGKFLASENNVIVVSVSYRLGPFGFSFLGPDTIPGNMGLMDQRMAIKWVHDNIENFGGDANKITLLGESAGGASVSFQLLSPLSRDLFTSAIMQSGAPTAAWASHNKTRARKYVYGLGGVVGCNTTNDADLMDCLQSVDAKSIAENQVLLMAEGFVFRPVVDGYFLQDDPKNLLKRGEFKKNNILTGVVRDESILFIAPYLGFPGVQNISLNKDLFEVFARNFAQQEGEPPVADAMIHYYVDSKLPSARPSYLQILNELESDVEFRCPAVLLASAYAKGNSVYMYNYEHRLSTSEYPEWVGVPHTYDLEATFGLPLNDSLGFSDQEKELSRTMMTYWTNFAKSGNPNTPVAVRSQWPQFEATQLLYKVIDVGSNLATRAGLRHEQCVFVSHILPMISADDKEGPATYLPIRCTSAGVRQSFTAHVMAGILILGINIFCRRF